MTRTTTLHVVRSLLLFTGSCGVLIAGAHKDYEGCVGECEKRLEAASHHCLDDEIYYETGQKPEFSKTCGRQVEQDDSSAQLQSDRRIEKVRRFFEKCKCPAVKYSALFVQVSDENGLDWRLLPTLAFLESTGGKHPRQNNIFGWNSGRTRFSSVPEGIRTVAKALSEKKVYAHKTTVQKIRTYNVHSRYLRRALEIMRQLDRIPLDT